MKTLILICVIAILAALILFFGFVALVWWLLPKDK